MVYILIDVASCRVFGRPKIPEGRNFIPAYIADGSPYVYDSSLIFNAEFVMDDLYNKLPGDIHLLLGPGHMQQELATKLRRAGQGVYNIGNTDEFQALVGGGWYDTWN
jgi:hypothetical protein